MKRLFFQEKFYNYSSLEESAKHIEEMKEKGWNVKTQRVDNNGNIWYVHKNKDAKYPYMAEFYKEY